MCPQMPATLSDWIGSGNLVPAEPARHAKGPWPAPQTGGTP